MRIIGLHGHANCGKSEALNRLKELLRESGKSISSRSLPSRDEPETFEYNGLVVCVAPGGDTKHIVENNCCYFKEKGCDVAVCATRTKWGSVDALNGFAAEEGVEIEWVAKSYEYSLSDKTKELCNQETAELLFKMI